MTELELPVSVEQITAEWLTSVLREGGAIHDAAVKSFGSEIVGEGAGFIGQLGRLTLVYDQTEQGAPASLIAKFPTPVAENRQIGDVFRLYEREGNFYRELAGEISLRTPRCYYCGMDKVADQYVLLLEDLAPARVGDQLAGCSSAEVDLAIEEVAKFHAAWWESPRLKDLDWMPSLTDPMIVQPIVESYQTYWDPFLAGFGDKLSSSMLETAKRFGRCAAEIMDQLAKPPRTISHGDYRLDNMFFGTEDGGDPFAVIDWQVAYRARGVFDVAYFLCGTLQPSDRRAMEMDILRRYHELLRQHGVRGYEFDECVHDYRLAALFCLAYAVIVGGSLDFANERGVALADAYVDRIIAVVEDLNAAELLPA